MEYSFLTYECFCNLVNWKMMFPLNILVSWQCNCCVWTWNIICFLLFSDIQEFYEITLLDDSKTTHQKTLETLQIASKWERQPPITNSQPLAEVRQTLNLLSEVCINTLTKAQHEAHSKHTRGLRDLTLKGGMY